MKAFFYFTPAIFCLITLAASTPMPSPTPSPDLAGQTALGKSGVDNDGATSSPISSEERKDVLNQINEKYNEFKFNERLYGFLFFSCIITAALVSALSALILKLRSLEGKSYTTDTAACLACMATLLITINTTVGFNAMWRSNRFARIGLDSLKIKCIKSSFKKDEILEKLDDIVSNQREIEK